MSIKAIFNEFKSQVAFVLLLIWLLAVWHFQTLNSFLYPLLSVTLVTALDVVYTRLRYQKWYWPSASFVTGALIGLIIAPTEPIWIIMVATLVAFVSKQFIGAGVRQHIFNPAALGIMTVALAFGTPVAWWGVTWGKLPLVILIPVMVRILWRMKRLWLSVGFLTIYFIYYLTLFDPKAAFLAIVDGSLLLFALVMLTEPITTPAVGNYKFLFGPAVAIVSIGLSRFNLAEVFLPALLTLDLVTFGLRSLNKKSTQVAVKRKNRSSDQKGAMNDSKKSL